ncbi:MAG: hypothetical protein RL272_274 [Candidatus Parcubacteria bacterium]|jgi:hypothetical protein
MRTQDLKPVNIDGYADFIASGLKPGDKVHLGVVGGHVSDEAVLRGVLEDPQQPINILGVKVEIGGQVIDLYWGDLVEFWKR